MNYVNKKRFSFAIEAKLERERETNMVFYKNKKKLMGLPLNSFFGPYETLIVK